MSTAFNPYAEWLEIDADRAVPNHYELLALPIFEEDQGRIRSQYWDRFEKVRRYEVGAYTELALKLLEEISQAFQCLSDPAAKEQYDRRLREKLATSTTLAGELKRTTLSGTSPAGAAEEQGPILDLSATIPEADSSSGGKPVSDERQPVRVPTWIAETGVLHERPPFQETNAPAVNPLKQFWQDAPHLVLGGAAGAVLVLIFCIVMLSSSSAPDSENPQASAARPSLDQDGPSLVAASQSAPPKLAVRESRLYEWTGALKRAFAVPEGTSDLLGVHLIIDVDSSTAPDHSAPFIEAYTSDLAFLKEVADFRSDFDGVGEADQVVISGRPLGEVPAALMTLTGAQSRVELTSIRRADGSSVAAVGQRRNAGDFRLATETRGLVTALRTIGADAQFDAVVESSSSNHRAQVRVDGLRHRIALAFDPFGGAPSRLPVGQQVSVRGRVSGGNAAASGGVGAGSITFLEDATVRLRESTPVADASPAANATLAETTSGSDANEYASPLRTIEAPSGTLVQAAWSPSGDLIGTVASDGAVEIWHGESGVPHSAGSESAPLRSSVWSELKWSPDGNWVLAEHGAGAKIWNVATRSESPLNLSLQELSAPPEWIGRSPVVMLAGANRLAFAGPEEGTPNGIPISNAFRVILLAATRKGNWAAAAFENTSLRPPTNVLVFQPLQQLVLTLLGGSSNGAPAQPIPEEIREVLVREDLGAPYVRCAVQTDHSLLLFQQNLAGGNVQSLLKVNCEHKSPNPARSWSNNGRYLAIASGAQVDLYDLRSRSPSASTALAAIRSPRAIAFAPDSIHLAAGSAEAGFAIWNCEENREVVAVRTKSPIRMLDWRSDAQRLAVLHEDGALTIWDTSVVPEVSTSPLAPQGAPPGGGVFNPLGSILGDSRFGFPLGGGVGDLGGFGPAPQAPTPGAVAENPEPETPQPPAEAGPAVNFQLEFRKLQLLASQNSWEEFHEAYEKLEDSPLGAAESIALRKLKGGITILAKQQFAATSAVRLTLGKSNPAQYQAQLRRIIAMIPGNNTADQAERLLNQSIEESGDLAGVVAPKSKRRKAR